jgi:hypothetical protein
MCLLARFIFTQVPHLWIEFAGRPTRSKGEGDKHGGRTSRRKDSDQFLDEVGGSYVLDLAQIEPAQRRRIRRIPGDRLPFEIPVV